MSNERLAVLPQYLLPKGALTRLAGRVAGAERGATTTRLIRWFVGRYGVDMSEAAEPDIAAYKSFNDFFTRALKPGARPLAQADLVCPVDGAISQYGRIRGAQIYQAKGHDYSTRALVGGDAELASRFDDGHFATLYLAPKDYHRIHMPCAGRLVRMLHVPGELFSVNPTTARGVPGLFARNERVVCVFEGTAGPFVHGAGGRHHRRQHGHRVARRGQPAAAGPGARMALRGPGDRAGAGRRDGALPAWLDRGAAVPDRRAAVQPGLDARRRHPPGRDDGAPLGHSGYSGRRPSPNMISSTGAGRPSAANQRL